MQSQYILLQLATPLTETQQSKVVDACKSLQIPNANLPNEFTSVRFNLNFTEAIVEASWVNPPTKNLLATVISQGWNVNINLILASLIFTLFNSAEECRDYLSANINQWEI